MTRELTREEVAILIRARRIGRETGISAVTSVSDICNAAGISRKTGYQWAGRDLEPSEQGAIMEELSHLRADYKQLQEEHKQLNFEHEGLELAWEIHRVDEILAEKKSIAARKNGRKQ